MQNYKGDCKFFFIILKYPQKSIISKVFRIFAIYIRTNRMDEYVNLLYIDNILYKMYVNINEKYYLCNRK